MGTAQDPVEGHPMKGVIFNAVEDAVERSFGADGWDDTLGRAEVDGSYTSLGNYGDEELAAIVGALPDETGGTIPERLRWVGINCVPFLVEAFPHFFDEITLEDFLPALNHMITQRCASSTPAPRRPTSTSPRSTTRPSRCGTSPIASFASSPKASPSGSPHIWVGQFTSTSRVARTAVIRIASFGSTSA